ncbi:MAG: HAMP domain-containing histidine kinase, partial [Proteobacteria bacterium]|nr:HAMP domain-containing histidine kinase [Pseudomonadota bacterium]
VIDKVLLLVNDEFMMNAITVKINAEEDIFMLGIENEFKHIVLNIINNAKDAFIDNDVKERIININIGKDGKRVQVEFVDNAGGIPEGVVDNIFKANVTTKERGTGIGLYMSAQIAQKSNGVLTAENVDGGAKLTFST